MPTNPQASSAIAIQTPPASRTASNTNSRMAISISPNSYPALDRALDYLLGSTRLRLLVARRMSGEHVHELVEECDQQDGEPAGISELRNPQRDRDHPLRHLVEAPRIVSHPRGMPGEEANEAGADQQGDDLDDAAA